MSQQAAPGLVVRERDAAEPGADDVGDAVVLRQSLVDERVVGRQQLEQAPILLHQMVKEELGLPSHRLLELLVEVGVGAHVRMQPVEVGQPKPLGREPCGKRLGTRVGQHPVDLPREDIRLRESPLVG